MIKVTVLLIEDDENFNYVLTHFIQKNGFDVVSFLSTDEFLNKMGKITFDTAVLDINLGQITGFDVMKIIKRENQDIPCILITAYGNINDAVKAIREGAYDYIVKPFKEIELIHKIKNAIKSVQLEKENLILKDKISNYKIMDEIVGESEYIRKLMETVKNVAENDVNVFLSGPTGTGKEIVARAIHNMSSRASYHFIPINCASIPDNLLESELFGYLKGSFTGAVADRKGKFEIANEGTIFLDEISEMPIHLQAKLLRVVQEKEFEPIGSNKTVKLNSRFISASNKNVEEEITKGNFRQDLFYRLNIFPIRLLPLKEHMEDIPLLIQHFFKKHGFPGMNLTKECLKKLWDYDWPGNVRELENILSFARVNAKGTTIDIRHLPDKIINFSIEESKQEDADNKTLGETDRQLIIEALKVNRGNQTKTAQQLGVTRAVLIYKMKKLGITNTRDYK
ncbi:MAG: sigma-54 dependent transcriptional regulator [bacterium]|nr:sigma-54 dependent transcriptional regulator [bacterium]